MLTPEQEVKLMADADANAKALAALAPLAGEVTQLKSNLAAKDAEIAELKKTSTHFTQQESIKGLKSAYPDVPDASLLAVVALTADQQKAVLTPIQVQAAEFKVIKAKNDPTSGWADAGSVSPSTEAERQALKVEGEKAYHEHKKTGNVFGMLDERAGEIAAHVRRAFTPSR